MAKRSISYEDLGKVDQTELERLARAGMLDDATLGRIAHLGRFLGRLGSLAPTDLKIGDVFSEDELQAIWRETADEGIDVGRCPSFAVQH